MNRTKAELVIIQPFMAGAGAGAIFDGALVAEFARAVCVASDPSRRSATEVRVRRREGGVVASADDTAMGRNCHRGC